MRFDYFYGAQAEQFSFYRIPRLLVKDKRFKKLSSDAKILYGLMLDRVSLSMKNGWIDEQGRAYIYYTVEEIMDELCCSKPTGVKIVAELDGKKGIGLIEKIRQGLGKPDIIYVKDFTSGEDGGNEEPFNSDEFPEVKKFNLWKSRNFTSEGKDSEPSEVKNFNFCKSNNFTSGGKETEPAEVKNLDPNYNKYNQTDNNQTESIHPSSDQADPYVMDGSDGWNAAERSVDGSYGRKVKARFVDESDERKVTEGSADGWNSAEGYMALIRRNIEYEHYMTTGEIRDKELVEELYQLICDIVCVKRETVRIGGEDYPYELVKSRFLKIRQPHVEYVMEAMRNTTSKIHDIRSYLITALYRAPDTMNHYYQQEVNHDFYGREDDG